MFWERGSESTDETDIDKGIDYNNTNTPRGAFQAVTQLHIKDFYFDKQHDILQARSSPLFL